MHKEIKSPWVDRFDMTLDLTDIKSRAEHIPSSIPELRSFPTQVALAKIRTAFDQTIVLTDLELAMLERLVHRSYAFSTQAYPSVREFMRNLHRRELTMNAPPPVCLTGLAGTGKSTLISAFTRALPAQQDIDLGPFVVGGVIPSKSYLRVRVDAGTNLADLLNPWLQPEPSHGKEKMSELGPSVVRKSKPRASIATLVPAAARYSYRIGLTASLVDEMQFLTQGASANAQVTKFLLMMSYIGVPLIYAANYSLCNKLLNRHQEDRDRLVSDVIVLSPMKQTYDELGRILKAYDQILGDCVKGSLCEFLEDYGAMTLGIKRKVKELTLAAFEEMRRTKELTISRKHIRTAFQKRVSAVSQNDIQLILAQSNSGKPARGRSDLWCPFGEEFNVFTLPARAQSVKHEQAIGQTLLRDSLTATEKALLNSTQKLDQATTSSIARDVKSRDRSSSSKRESISAEDLLANTISYQKNPSTQRKRQ